MRCCRVMPYLFPEVLAGMCSKVLAVVAVCLSVTVDEPACHAVRRAPHYACFDRCVLGP
jgi:hypothetical protein